MKQWAKMKESIGDDVLLFCRVGDFYELFYDDATIGAKVLDLVLTHRKIRDTDHPLAGVPVRSVEQYVSRLVNKGYKVAIADQLENPKAVKGVVKRGITRIVTRGTLTEGSLIDTYKNNYLASIISVKDGRSIQYGLAIADLSCSEFYAKTVSGKSAIQEFLFYLDSMRPVEFLFPQSHLESLKQIYTEKFADEYEPRFTDGSVTRSPQPDFWFDTTDATEYVKEYFGVSTLEGYGLIDNSPGASASGALLRYLNETQKRRILGITGIKALRSSGVMVLDSTAVKSLDLFENNVSNTADGTLLQTLNQTKTQMGARELTRWIGSPLTSPSKINARLDMVALFLEHEVISSELGSELDSIGDLERLSTRVTLGIAKPAEIQKLKNSLICVQNLTEGIERMVAESGNFSLKDLQTIDPGVDIVHYINKMILSSPANSIADGYVMNSSVNSRLHELREILDEGEKWAERYAIQEKAKTGITSLKIKQNRHLGYYLEISRSNLSRVPDYYISRQSMVNFSRFTTKELNQWENDILNAEIEVKELEDKLYRSFLKDLSENCPRIQETARKIAVLDCLLNFASISNSNNYNRPQVVKEKLLDISGIRHPVIETSGSLEHYTPNDVLLLEETQRLLIITGPNFSGKSSLLRALALVVIMAQIGCFVPASSAKLGVIDRIFTRIGAFDILTEGQSTFMVEMKDAANLVNNATERSLIIADELGRGTSTYDGLAIAWAISEHLVSCMQRPFVVIATHFHQLSELQNRLEATKNYHFKIGFDGENPLFDHKLLLGSSDRSFGVEVAKLAGLPRTIILRARFILSALEGSKPEETEQPVGNLIEEKENQGVIDEFFSPTTSSVPTMVQNESLLSSSNNAIAPEELEVLATLNSLSLDDVTPRKALDILHELKVLLELKSKEE